MGMGMENGYLDCNLEENSSTSTTNIDRLQIEFRSAVNRADTKLLKEWGARSAKRFGIVFARRITNLAGLLARLTDATADEVSNALQAFGDGHFGEHISSRSNAAVHALTAIQNGASKTISTIKDGFSRNPADSATKLFSAVIGFYAGSGGNGDGGIPDLDLLAGIGAHRSIFTHSIIAGAFVETAVLSLVDLTQVIYEKLPADHDPFWNQLLKYQNMSGESFVTGASLGIAAHLGIDTTIDGFTPYKDLPISLPIGLHEALMGLNSVAEGVYGLHRMTEKYNSVSQVFCTKKKNYSFKNRNPMDVSDIFTSPLLASSGQIDPSLLKSLPSEEKLEKSAEIVRRALQLVHLSTDALDKAFDDGKTKIENASQPFRLGVIGEFRSGKSTLINALIGEEIAFVDFLEATPAECVFRYGLTEKSTFVYRDGTKKELPVELANQTLSSRREDVQWLHTIDYVEYVVPSERLKNFDLWDAPGMGGSSSNQAVADKFLEKLGAALWVFDATLLGKATIAAALSNLKKSGKPVIAVINRIDEFNDSIEEAFELIKRIYPNTFDSLISISALESFDAITRGESCERLDHLWKEVERCVGVTTDEINVARIERAANLACSDFGRWTTGWRRNVQDIVGLVDHVRENLHVSSKKVIQQIENTLSEETDRAFGQIEIELSAQVAKLNSTDDSALKVIDFFNDPRTQERVTQEILERSLEKINGLWRRSSDHAIDLSIATLPLVTIQKFQSSPTNSTINSQALEEGVYTGGVSLAVAAAIAATTAVTWPAILVAIPIGSLAAWRKRRELERGSSPQDDFLKAMLELRRQFVAHFLPRASTEIQRSLLDSIDQLLVSRCSEVLGEVDDTHAKTALTNLIMVESALNTSTEIALATWSASSLMNLLQNPGSRLDIYTPSLDFSLSPILQVLPPDTIVRLITTSDEDQRKLLNLQAEHAFGNWQGKRKVFCVCTTDGKSLPLLQTMLVTTDESLVTAESLSRLNDGVLELHANPNGRLAGQRAFGELWDGWSSTYGELRRYPVF